MPQNEFLWRAFHLLRGSRTQDGAIPFSEIKAYGDWVGMTDPVQKMHLLHAIIAMDNTERAAHGPEADP